MRKVQISTLNQATKWLIFHSKIDILKFLGMENFHKKFRVHTSKIVDFFLMSNFWWSFLCFFIESKKREMTNKSQRLGKNPQFLRYQFQIFCANFLYPETPAYQFWSKKSAIQQPNFKLIFRPFLLTRLFLKNCIFKKH